MSAGTTSIRDVLYEAPGPKARRWIALGTAASLAALAAVLFLVLRQFYITGQFSAKYWKLFTQYSTWRFLGQGLAGTLKAALTASVLVFFLGMLLMLGRISRFSLLRGICTVLVEFSRGVPTLLFIYFFFLVVPRMGVKISAFWKIAAPVAISAAGMVAEVLRSGVNAVPKGQREAAVSLGMSERSVFFKIVFPQAFRSVIPALISEIVIVLKDTTFAYVVNFPDLMQNAKVLISNHDALLSVYLVVAVIYILINYLLNKASVAAARRSAVTTTVPRRKERRQ